jgi:DNA processing protein
MLVERGAIVVSGLADGVDTEAHTTAIESGGRTIAVLGTPLDRVFPVQNRELQDRIMREHLAVSQFEYPAGPKSFPMRNRTMALLSDATVITEAGEKSGSRHQGWEALRLGRPLFLMESLVAAGHSWPKEMLSYDAQILKRDDIEFLFEFLPQGARDESDSLTL